MHRHSKPNDPTEVQNGVPNYCIGAVEFPFGGCAEPLAAVAAGGGGSGSGQIGSVICIGGALAADLRVRRTPVGLACCGFGLVCGNAGPVGSVIMLTAGIEAADGKSISAILCEGGAGG
ncbi:MAG TPA: hypothetical protein VGG11_20920 [Xanthobacteraceae bacterium]|jgi:hypothetical protein